MHTLADLTNGRLQGQARVNIRDDLTEFPKALVELADHLEILDLSHNRLQSLPEDILKLTKLKVIFLSDNLFTEYPAVLGRMPNLEMVGLKANQIQKVAESALSKNLRWLILTDNRIEALPESIGKLQRLQKLMLAGNRLTHLPSSMSSCQNLQLLRVSANRLHSLPDWIFSLPNLRWLAFSGNDYYDEARRETLDFDEHLADVDVPKIVLNDIELFEQLGEGASGNIYRALWQKKPESLGNSVNEIAVKIFKGSVTSDGFPEDELDVSLRTSHTPNVVRVIAELVDEGTHGSVMELLPRSLKVLGDPPSLASCTRDQFNAELRLSSAQIVRIASEMLDTMTDLHHRGICHGDFYAHNILTDKDNHVLLSDFGAATLYKRGKSKLSPEHAKGIEIIEVRAYGCLLDDLLSLCSEENPELLMQLEALRDQCINANIENCEGFSSLKIPG